MTVVPFPSTLSIPTSSKEKIIPVFPPSTHPAFLKWSSSAGIIELIELNPKRPPDSQKVVLWCCESALGSTGPAWRPLAKNLIPSPFFPSSYTKGSFTQEAACSDGFLTTAAGSCTVAHCCMLLLATHLESQPLRICD